MYRYRQYTMDKDSEFYHEVVMSTLVKLDVENIFFPNLWH